MTLSCILNVGHPCLEWRWLWTGHCGFLGEFAVCSVRLLRRRLCLRPLGDLRLARGSAPEAPVRGSHGAPEPVWYGQSEWLVIVACVTGPVSGRALEGLPAALEVCYVLPC